MKLRLAAHVSVVTGFWLTLLLVSGCASTSGSGSGTPAPAPAPAPSSSSISGNWQAVATPATGTSSISAISGSFNQQGNSSAAGQFTTGVLHITGDCFVASPLVPVQGYNKTGVLSLDSYSLNGQTVHFSATADGTGSALQGSYQVNGGCANGANGSFQAVRYAALTGTYAGTLSSGATAGPVVTLSLTQNASETGSGTFLLTGNITVAGTGCTMKGTAVVSGSNFVQGSSLQISFPAADASGSTAKLTGTFDVAASTLSNLSLAEAGGTCAGLTATGTLKR